MTENNMDLNLIIHERARLVLLTALANSEGNKLSFNELKVLSDLSSGNLSIQMKNLEEAGYITIQKSFVNKRPQTLVLLLEKGRYALEEYLDQMESILKTIKEGINK